MKKEVLILFVLVLLLVGFVAAQSDRNEKISKAFVCLDDEVSESSSLSLGEAVFSALADVPEEIVLNTIDEKKSGTENCWSSGGCSVEETAQVLLVKDKLGEDTDDIANWLISKSKTSPEITWYLQIIIDNNAASKCSVSYPETDKSVTVRDDMKLEIDSDSCLSVTNSGYWLKISDNCLDNEYAISCDAGFKTNLLYEKNAGGTIFISSGTHPKDANGRTTEKINAKCFMNSEKCDYEDSLWAASALKVAGKDVSEYVPYLLALAPENKKYFPSAFLMYIIGGSVGEKHYENVVGSAKPGPYWEMPGSDEGKYYDTSLALLALGGVDADGAGDTAEYLFGQQTEKGCWNNNDIKDTAFIIYSAGWSGSRSRGGKSIEDPLINTSGGNESIGDGGGPIYNPDIFSDCESGGYYCSQDVAACLEAGGDVLPEDSYGCDTFVQSCCTVKAASSGGLESCFDLNGDVCSADETCPGNTVASLDGACCLDSCEKLGGGDTGGNTGGAGGTVTSSEEKGGSIWWIIIVLLILIVLIIIGIIKRDKLRVWWLKVRGKAKTSGIAPSRAPPRLMAAGKFVPKGVPRFAAGIRRPVNAGRIPLRKSKNTLSEKEKEREKTLEKLRKISE